jgi:hypothetical protein
MVMVRPWARVSNAFWTARSVSVSRALVASSSTSTRGSRSRVLPGELHSQSHCRQERQGLGHSGRQGRLHEGPLPVHGCDYRRPGRGSVLAQALRPARAPGIPAQHAGHRRRAPVRGLLAGHNLDCAGQPDLRDLLSDPAAAVTGIAQSAGESAAAVRRRAVMSQESQPTGFFEKAAGHVRSASSGLRAR